MAESTDGYIKDPGLIEALEQAWAGKQKYLGNPAPTQNASPIGQDSMGNPTDATPQSAQAAFMAGQDPRGQYTGSQFPGSPGRGLTQGVLSGLGQTMQIGSALVSPASRMVPQIQRMVQGMGRAGSVAPALAESGIAATGAALQGGSMADIALSAGMPPAVRAFHENTARRAGRAMMAAMTPDQLTAATMKNIENTYGPPTIASKLWETEIRPYNKTFLATPETAKALQGFQLPMGGTANEQNIATRLLMITDKYNINMRGRQMNLPRTSAANQGRMGQNSFGMTPTSVDLGTMYDDAKMLDLIAADARKYNLNNYASNIVDLKARMMDDMVGAFPQLKAARAASVKDGNVHRLWDIMTTEKPAIEWMKVKDSSQMRKAFPSSSEMADISHTMDMMSNVGGGSHWIGRILGHATGAILGGGAGGLVGGDQGAMAGASAGGALAPFVMGELMANWGGRAFLRGLMKRDPVGLTPASANAIMQWFISKRKAGNEETPADSMFGRK